ncbi:MAG TPA: YggT family protein [Streptosporangiaceae bacterium]|nr:YggT family protein [Streptosporangiaceae bacterium]
MNIARDVLFYALSVYLVLLIIRLIFTWVQMYARSWTPTGVLLVIAEGVYSATDPPLRFLRRYIRPVRIGSVALDLSFILLFLVVYVLWQVVQY